MAGSQKRDSEFRIPGSFLGATASHAAFVGLLLGLATSPVVGAVVPVLLAFGGLRVFERLSNSSLPEDENTASSSVSKPSEPTPFTRMAPSLLILWCTTAATILLLAIALRTGTFGTHSSIVSMLASSSGAQPADASLALGRLLLASRLDQLDLSRTDRRTLAAVISRVESVEQLIVLQKAMDAGSRQPSPDEHKRFQMYSY